jgi:TetR/AcrR family transcriptional regulator, transcriptional repressor for nem operon
MSATTRDEIVRLAEELLLLKGYNWFSYADISKQLGIKNAAIHYHFPTKEDLGLAIINRDTTLITQLMAEWESKHHNAVDAIAELFAVYASILQGNQVCLIGSLGTDMLTLPDQMQAELKSLVDDILRWLEKQLRRGQSNGTASFAGSASTQALAMLSTMVAGIQLARLHKSTKEFAVLTEHALSALRPAPATKQVSATKQISAMQSQKIVASARRQ